MSRYSATLENGREIVWGYDPPLQEYFFQEYWNPEEMKAIEETIDELSRMDDLRFCISSHNTLCPHPDTPGKMDYSNGEILEIMESYPQIPEVHKLSIAMDQPF